jgi:hypothetical protein
LNAQEIISSGILELYCTGLSSAAETAEVQQWAKQYPEVAAEITAIQAGLEGYAQAHAIAPAASVKEKVFAEINKSAASPVVNMPSATSGTAKVYSISSAWKYAAAASIILLVGSLVLNYTYYNKYQSASKDLEVAQTSLQETKAIAQSKDSTMNLMGDMHAMPVSLKSTDTTAEMGARIYWMKNTNEVYIDPTYLPTPEKGKQYEFWAIVDGKPVNGGIIKEINGHTVRLQKMKSFGNVQAFAVSIENIGPAKVVPDKVMAVGKI